MIDVVPLSATLSLTGLCNSRCAYCDSWKSPVKGAKTADWLEIIDQLPGLGIRYLSLSGGEPLMREDLPTLVAKANQNGMIVQMLTNGLMLTGRTFNRAVEAGLQRINISIDTLDENTYHLLRGIRIERVLEGLETAIQTRSIVPGFAIALKCVLTKMNLGHVSGLIDLSRKHHLYLSFQPLHTCFVSDPEMKRKLSCSPADLPALQEAIEEILTFQQESDLVINHPDYLANFPMFLLTGEQPATFICEAADSVVNIDPELNLKPCWLFPSSGNLRSNSLVDLWNGDELTSFRKKVKSMRCKGCWLTCHADIYQNRDPLEDHHEN